MDFPSYDLDVPGRTILEEPPVADVALDLPQARMATDSLEHPVAENVEIEHRHAVAPGQELGDQNRPHIARSTGDQDAHLSHRYQSFMVHLAPRRPTL